jgi:tRNA-dihydrouridine synthase A
MLPRTAALSISTVSKKRSAKFRVLGSSNGWNAKTGESSLCDPVRSTKYQELMDASRFSLAPMMDYTDRHFRHLVRLISSKTLLYTEMVAANAIYHERLEAEASYRSQNPSASEDEVQNHFKDNYLRRALGQGQVSPLEGPCVLQLGGSDPQQMYEAARTVMVLAQREGFCNYTAINLNCGCPSPKVAGKGCFGAALMEDPHLVSELTKALHDGCEGKLPVTVKCRIGTDSIYPISRPLSSSYGAFDQEEYTRLCNFVETVASKGIVTDFVVHARIAVLQKSFSPAENRKIPPLKYDVIRRLVQDYPDFTFTLNGGITSLAQAQREFGACPNLSGIMVGRAWAADPWSFAMTDSLLYETPGQPSKNRWQVLLDYGKHADKEEALGNPVNARRFIIKAVLPLFAGEPNSKRYRIALDEIAGIPKKLMLEQKSLETEPSVSELILNAAAQHLSEEVLLRTPEESYERFVWEEKKRQANGETCSNVLSDWQQNRKMGVSQESRKFASA